MGYDLHITRKEYWFEEEQNANDIYFSNQLEIVI